MADLALAYPIPITDRPRTRAIGATLTDQERGDVLTGARGYRDFIASTRKSNGAGRAAMDAHRWLGKQGWQSYLPQGRAVEARALRCDVRAGSDQWKAWTVFYAICGEVSGIPAFFTRVVDGTRVFTAPTEWPPVGRWLSDDIGTWIVVEDKSQPLGAWCARLREAPSARIPIREHWIGGAFKRGLLVPCRWPPKRDGTIYADDATEPATALANEEIAR